ncbi:MAG: penicillin-binding transpeptidase domain-containing protein [Sarcina sp.]|uniref:penicillin-binding transpeptidase domain-containing protein n=1 Tax=Clostridium sp. TaxID=1506 RepID=UPI003F360B08
MRKLTILLTLTLFTGLYGCSAKSDTTKTDEPIELVETAPIRNEVDYSSSFKDTTGCAVFFTPDTNTYNIYNKDLINEQISPYSTFKIINSLMALSQNVVTSPDSKLGYDGTIHWRESWNKDIPFKDAFKESCVWYYEKLMDSLNKDYVQETLSNLKYGNSNLTAWNEQGHNTYWISSSLKISPIEQISVLENIFEGKSNFDPSHVEIVKDFMLIEKTDNLAIYGKTGSAKDTNGWFTGFLEKEDERTYFAIRIKDKTKKLPGSLAKDITLDIINKNFFTITS